MEKGALRHPINDAEWSKVVTAELAEVGQESSGRIVFVGAAHLSDDGHSRARTPLAEPYVR